MSPLLAGLVTLHLAFPQVLSTYPSRTCPDCDGYIATASCADIGTRYTLVYHSRDYTVQVADCLAPGDPNPPFPNWIADLDADLWRGPRIPQRAQLWNSRIRQAYLFRLNRVQ